MALFAELDAKIDKHANLHKPQESGMSTEQYSEALKVWEVSMAINVVATKFFVVVLRGRCLG